MKNLLTFTGGILLLFSCSGVSGQAVPTEPRAYLNVPKGTQSLGAYYTYADANFPSLQNSHYLNESGIHNNIVFTRFASFFSVGGKTAGVNVMLPYTFVDGNIPNLGLKGSNAGFGDISVTIGSNIIGAPSLTLPEFVKYKQKTILSWSLQFTGPTGKYDTTAVLNIGTNHWIFKPELGLSQAFGKGFIWDFYPSVMFTTPNRMIKNGHKETTKPIMGLDTHISYSFTPAIWASADFFSQFGGETAVDGTDQDDRQATIKVGATVKGMLKRRHLFGLAFMKTVHEDQGADVLAVTFSYMYTLRL
ncbi:transporter [Chitinophaga barathri]|uniref:Transporter n=1 Tax=Chitinophaga barathri TaxID=1647451 RepID=A0A3N4MHM5_9BACT|nr:transporter [Chitinophaga barathri]RPD39139.1 transporter [Chitinophaga barathri]